MTKRTFKTKLPSLHLSRERPLQTARLSITGKAAQRGPTGPTRYKWERRHPPMGDEAAHFREANTVVNVNTTFQLNNGMHVYKEVSLQGNGNINMQNPVPHLRTVNIPASATGFANMT